MNPPDLSPAPDHLVIKRHPGGVLEMIINRPTRLNALTAQLRTDLADAFRIASSSTEVGAVVLTGAGERAFAAGQDLDESKDFSPASINGWIDSFRDVYWAVLECDKPTVAALNGYAVGSGMQLALLCDIRIAAEHARMGMPEVDDGIPCITGAWTLYEAIGRSRTAELLLTGRMLDAKECRDWGMVADVVPSDQLNEKALELGRTLAAKPPVAVRLDKLRMRRLIERDWPETERFAKAAHAEAYATGVPQQKMADFLAGRRDGRSD